MRKALVLFFALFISLSLHAQNDVPADEIPADEYINIEQDLYSMGDQTFNISVGTSFPTVFYDYKNRVMTHNLFVVGGEGIISYNYFLGHHLFAGLEISGMFTQTIAENMFFMIPINAKIGWQFIAGRFEFPLSVAIGMVPQQYVEQRYFGMMIKPAAAAYFRWSPEWSFGLDTAWWWTPQWPKDEKQYVYGNYVSTSLSVRYHF